MTDFDQELRKRLEELRAAGLYRELRRVDSCQSTRIEMTGQTLLNFASNDYLGLANHPELTRAAREATERFGAGSKASPLISGFLGPHRDLDETLAAFKGTEAALSFSTGYAAAIGTISAVAGKDDIVVLDKLVHASLVDGARLSGAKLRVFHHNDLNDLEDILKWANESRPSRPHGRVIVITESVFSMDGDHAPLKEIVELKEKYGAWLMVDEAHGTGLYGTHRRGLAEDCGVSDRVEIQMGTLGKAIGASGGFICGSRMLIDYLVNRARTYIFSTSAVPAAPAAAAAGIRLVQAETGEERQSRLWENWEILRAGLGALQDMQTLSRSSTTSDDANDSGRGLPHSKTLRELQKPAEIPIGPGVRQPSAAFGGCAQPVAPGQLVASHRNCRSAIIPIMIGDERKAIDAASALRKKGIFIPAIRYPTVARGKARLRVTVTAAHTEQDIIELLNTLKTLDIEF